MRNTNGACDLCPKSWSEFCGIDYEQNKEKIKELNALISALGNKALGKFEESKPVWQAVQKAIKELREDRMYWASINNIRDSEEMDARPQEKSLLQLFTYLLMVEGYYSKIVTILSILLIENGHEIYDPITCELVTKFEQLERMDLSIKLKFLKKHGFNLFVDSVDRKLRNDIAHLNVQVTNEGTVFNRKDRKELCDIDYKLKKLQWVCVLVGCFFDDMLWKNNAKLFNEIINEMVET